MRILRVLALAAAMLAVALITACGGSSATTTPGTTDQSNYNLNDYAGAGGIILMKAVTRGTTTIDGDSLIEGYTKWMPLSAVKFSPLPGSDSQLANSVSVSKPMDIATPKLAMQHLSGATLDSVTIVTLSPSADHTGFQETYKFELYGVTIPLYSQNLVEDDRGQEEMTLRFRQIRITMTPWSEAGVKGTPVVSGWDYVLNRPFTRQILNAVGLFCQ